MSSGNDSGAKHFLCDLRFTKQFVKNITDEFIINGKSVIQLSQRLEFTRILALSLVAVPTVLNS